MNCQRKMGPDRLNEQGRLYSRLLSGVKNLCLLQSHEGHTYILLTALYNRNLFISRHKELTLKNAYPWYVPWKPLKSHRMICDEMRSVYTILIG